MIKPIKNQKPNSTNWTDQLDVVNCGEFHGRQATNQVYACPTDKSAYSHKRCLYLGMYWGKSTQCVARIKGVVDIDPLDNKAPKVLWNNEEQQDYPNSQLIDDASKRLKACFPPDNDLHRRIHRVFVLDALTTTDFQKNSSGGMAQSKRYFWVGDEQVRADNTDDLAQNLRRFKWTDWN